VPASLRSQYVREIESSFDALADESDAVQERLVESRRGEIWWVRLAPTLGAEIAKTRALRHFIGQYVQQITLDCGGHSALHIAPASSPLLVPVQCDGREVVAVTDQVRAIAKQRLDRRLEELASEDLNAVEQGIREVLEL
jgi:mRNA-degrading endonuclease toxin of MazEF toxin-antitoxin module